MTSHTKRGGNFCCSIMMVNGGFKYNATQVCMYPFVVLMPVNTNEREKRENFFFFFFFNPHLYSAARKTGHKGGSGGAPPFCKKNGGDKKKRGVGAFVLFIQNF